MSRTVWLLLGIVALQAGIIGVLLALSFQQTRMIGALLTTRQRETMDLLLPRWYQWLAHRSTGWTRRRAGGEPTVPEPASFVSSFE